MITSGKNVTTRAMLSILLLCALVGAAHAGNWKQLGPFQWDAQDLDRKSCVGLGVIRCLEGIPGDADRLLAGSCTAGIWLTEDHGKSWRCTSSALPVEFVSALRASPAKPQIVYAATDHGVLRSGDGGRSWTPTSWFEKRPYPASMNVISVAIDRANPALVLAADKRKIAVSLNSGETWADANLETPMEPFELAAHPKLAGHFYLVGKSLSNGELLITRSEDGGKSFQRVTKGASGKEVANVKITRARIAVTPADPNRVIVFAAGSMPGTGDLVGFFGSSDAGKSFRSLEFPAKKKQGAFYRKEGDVENSPMLAWEGEDEEREEAEKAMRAKFLSGGLIEQSPALCGMGQIGWDMALAISNKYPARMHVGGFEVASSFDSGRTWKATSFGGCSDEMVKAGQWSVHPDIQDIIVRGKEVWVACDGGIWMSPDQGESYRPVMGFCAQELWGFSTDFKGRRFGTGVNHAENQVIDPVLFPGGARRISGADAMTASINPLDPDCLYTHPWGDSLIQLPVETGGRIESRDLGIRLGYIAYNNLEFHPHLAHTFYGIDYENSNSHSNRGCRICVTRDNASHWETLKSFPGHVRRIRLAFSNPEVLHVIEDRNLWRSIDGGKTWAEVAHGGGDAELNDISVDPDDPLCLTLCGHRRSGGAIQPVVQRTGNGGKRWDDWSQGLPQCEMYTLAPLRGTTGGVYCGTRMGVYYRNSSMAEWKPAGEGMPVLCSCHFVFPNPALGMLRVGTTRGIWECPLYETPQVSACPAALRNELSLTDKDDAKISFRDHSVLPAPGAKWQWEFAGGSPASSTMENPVIDYSRAKPGTYPVRLTVTDSTGRSDTCELKDFITIKP